MHAASLQERLLALLGPADARPRALEVAVGLCLASPLPMMVLWGRGADARAYFNQAAGDTLADLAAVKNGAALAAFETTACARSLCAALAEPAQSDVPLAIARVAGNAKAVDDATFDVVSTALVDDGGAQAGALVAFFDTTERAASERRTTLMTDLAARSAGADGPRDAGARAVEVLRASADVKACAVYVLDERGSLVRAAAAGFERQPSLAPEVAASLNAPWPFGAASQRRDVVRVESALGPAYVVAIPHAGVTDPHGFLVVVVANTKATRDARFALFLRLVAAEIGAAADAVGVHDERDRMQEFLAMLAHELRNPLAPIRTALTLLESRLGDDERARHYFETLARQSNNLARLVDDLLDVSRITRGLIELRKEMIDVGAVVDRALEALRPELDKKQINVAVTKPMRPLKLHADPVRLEQIVLNLVGNAAKYTNRGGHVRVVVESGDGEGAIRVQDDGVGIAPEVLPRIFDLFQQAQRSLDRSQGGLGIGLTIVKNLVALHGGSIEARSAGVGKGSEFVVRFPTHELERTSTPPSPVASPVVAVKGRRVLVVDDNIDAADTLADLAAEWGHTVKSAHSGPDAVRIATEMIPDVVLLDIGLPEMDGYEVARRMRANPALDDTFLVALTGYGQQRDRERAAEAGFDHHLVKPVDIDKLEALLLTARRRHERPMDEQVH